MFKETWPAISAGETPRIRQDSSELTYHRRRDVERIDEIDLDKRYVARDLINILRARTFPPYKGAYFVEGGRRIQMRLSLHYEED